MFSQDFFKQLAVNAVFWTGVLALGITLVNKDFSLTLFLAGIIAFNLLLASATRLFFPAAFKEAYSGGGGSVGFMLTPLPYPKVLDAELRDYAPEFIRFDIKRNGALVFSAELARDALRGLRDAMQGALEVKDSVAAPMQARKKK